MVKRQSCYKDQTPNSLLKAFLLGFSCSRMPCNERHWLLFLWTVFKDIFVVLENTASISRAQGRSACGMEDGVNVFNSSKRQMSFVLVTKDRKEPGSLSTRRASVFSRTIQHICKCHLFSLYHSVGVGVQKTDSKIKCAFFFFERK